MYPAETKFLIIDDQAPMRKFVKEVLAEMGYFSVIEAVDGQSALELLQDNADTTDPVNFIISDWSMPRMTGIELLKIIRSKDPFKALPFMLVSGERDEAHIIQAAKAGVSDYIVKPFSAGKIRDKIEKIYLRNLLGTRAA